MKLYHRTTIAEATEIVRAGFQDGEWKFDTRDRDAGVRKMVGVWLTDRPLNDIEGPPGDAVVEVDLGLSDDTLSAFEVEDVFWDARLWVIPAEVVNPAARMRIHQVDPRTSWWHERPPVEE
jgi:hypothetical protein